MVALIQAITVAVAIIGALSLFEVPWEGVLVTYVRDHALARGAVLSLGVLVLVAVAGMWRLRWWGWALMVALVGLSLLLDLINWWKLGADAGPMMFLRLGLDVVSAFYLNTRSVQDAFKEDVPDRPAIGNTRAAGRVDP